jgi:hypothetical protein
LDRVERSQNRTPDTVTEMNFGLRFAENGASRVTQQTWTTVNVSENCCKFRSTLRWTWASRATRQTRTRVNVSEKSRNRYELCFQRPVLSPHFSLLSPQSSVLSSRFSVLSSQFSVLGSQFSVLSSRFSVLSSQFSVLSSQRSQPDQAAPSTDAPVPQPILPADSGTAPHRERRWDRVVR